MFDYTLHTPKHFTRKADTESSFDDFKAKLGIERGAFPYSFDMGTFYKNKPIVYKVESWGFYQSSSGIWIVFIAYRYQPTKHTIYYRWIADEKGAISGDPVKHEFVN